MKQTIVVFSNPFGYGPTGNAIPVLKSLLNKTKDIDIVFAGSGLCMEIVPDSFVKKVHLDERNEGAIKEYLKTLSNPFVIGSQNRFCIRAARELQIPCAFIDVLAWFWKEIPQEHLLADEIFWIRFPKIESKVPRGQNNIHVVSGIIGTLPKTIIKGKQLTIHIGGAQYPFSNEIPRSYLNLMAKGLNALDVEKNFDSVLFAGGTNAIDYLKERVINPKIFLASLEKEKFIEELSKSTHMFTTAGVSSTLESFSLGIPTSFLLPLNLSHLALVDILLENDCAPKYLEWSSYVDVKEGLRDMAERDAIEEVNMYAKAVDIDDKLSQKFVDDFVAMATSIPDNSKQTQLMESIGEIGADEVVDVLISKWGMLLN